MKIYFAGKIKENDWRHELAHELRAVESWPATSIPMKYSHTYVGPFFIACDHGCGHNGPNAHGVGLGPGIGCITSQIKESDVLAASLRGIQSCEAFIVWADEDFHTAYGTLVEIGYALALRKPIILIAHPKLELKDVWFARNCAYLVVVADEPVQAITKLLEVIDKDALYCSKLTTNAEEGTIRKKWATSAEGLKS